MHIIITKKIINKSLKIVPRYMKTHESQTCQLLMNPATIFDFSVSKQGTKQTK